MDEANGNTSKTGIWFIVVIQIKYVYLKNNCTYIFLLKLLSLQNYILKNK